MQILNLSNTNIFALKTGDDMTLFMVFLRVLECLLDRISNLSTTDFIVKNVTLVRGNSLIGCSIFLPSTNIHCYQITNNKGFVDIFVNEFINMNSY